jgi:hypothetical protein
VVSDGATRARGLEIGRVPVLLAEPRAGNAPAPLVLWFHGFRADALAHAAELEACARRGFLAVGVDCVGHGARRDPHLPDRVRASPDGALPIMLDLVHETLAEIPSLVDALAASHGADRARCSMVGISMGAFLVYRAIATGLPLRAAVALLGSPKWEGATSPHRARDALRRVALLSITAEHDASVPPEATRVLHRALTAHGGAAPHRHHELAGAGHLTTAAEWAEAMAATYAWLTQHGR